MDLNSVEGAVVAALTVPSATYAGKELRAGLAAVVEAARRRLVTREGLRPNPRVVQKIATEAADGADELVTSYLGGVLASSFSPIGRDDRGVAWAATTGGLSAYSLRTHFIFYRACISACRGSGVRIVTHGDAEAARTYVRFDAYVEAMQFAEAEQRDAIFDHAVAQLMAANLIDPIWFTAGPAHVLRDSTMAPEATTEGILFQPTSSGIELFLWAHGLGDVRPRDAFDPALDIDDAVPIDWPPGSSMRVADMANPA